MIFPLVVLVLLKQAPPPQGVDWNALTAIGTLALAFVTVITVGVTIAITMQDRRRADARIRDERDHAAQALAEASAWTVEVIPKVEDHGGGATVLGVDVANLGDFTIMRVQAMFARDEHSLVAPTRADRLMEHEAGAYGLHASFTKSGYQGILTPRTAIRFWTDPLPSGSIKDPFPVVRWRDHWGQQWEHKLGTVRKVSEGEDWHV